LRVITAKKELTKQESKKFDTFFFGVGYKFIRNKTDIVENIRHVAEHSTKIQVFKVNNTAFLDEDLIKQCSNLNPSVSFGFSFIANTVPKYENKVLSFTHMAELSKGANKTGILKMDVDNLGKIFATGFVNEKANIARISTMSSMFDFYFSGFLNKICEKYYFIDGRQICDKCKEVARKIELPPLDETTKLSEILEPVYRFDGKEQPCNECSKNKIPAVYINYAGGDDLLIIGPWDSIVELASDIRVNFKKFTCQNADINISGGVSIISNKFPIGRAALLAGDLLEKSKDQGRNKMSVFGETVCWDTKYPIIGFHKLLDFSFELEDCVAKRDVSKGFIYSLMRMWQSNFGYGEGPIDKIRLERKAHIPLLKYKLARTVNEEIREKLDKKIQQVFPWVKIPVSWVSLRTR
jgi:CRISPR-associated protein Csm1